MLELRDKGIIGLDPDTRGGVPTLPSTRYPVSHLLANLSNTDTFRSFCKDMDFNPNEAKAVLDELAQGFDHQMVMRIKDG